MGAIREGISDHVADVGAVRTQLDRAVEVGEAGGHRRALQQPAGAAEQHAVYVAWLDREEDIEQLDRARVIREHPAGEARARERRG